MPFSGVIIYVDHEAGVGPGRDAGRMAEAQNAAIEDIMYILYITR